MPSLIISDRPARGAMTPNPRTSGTPKRSLRMRLPSKKLLHIEGFSATPVPSNEIKRLVISQNGIVRITDTE
jgi:hypothetical protein